jgi:hypothetical protein
MEKFIRLDMKGHWKGTDHRSSFQGVAEEGYWEKGVSCFSLSDVSYAIESLRSYWVDIASATESDFENMQVTIFEGTRIGEGSDYEDLATCKRTILEIEAAPFMKEVTELYELFKYDEEIDEDEYNERLEAILLAAL